MKSIQFTTPSQTTGIAVVDPIESTQLIFKTPTDVPLTADATAEQFTYPVDETVRTTLTRATLDQTTSVVVRTPDGECHHSFTNATTYECSLSEAILEFQTPIKLYLHVTNPVTITKHYEGVTLSFETPTTITIGARSCHTNPSATVTVPPDPESFVKVVDALGGAITEFSPERSWPTLRGHPPAIEVGDSLSIPDGYGPPNTGVTLVVPPTYEALYAVAPLSYYLGADTVLTDKAGDPPRIETDSGSTYPFPDQTDISTTANRLLQHIFFCDCITRTVGLYDWPLYEQRVFEDRLEEYDITFDCEALYNQSVGEQLDSYLSLPYEAIEDLIPKWSLCAHLPPTPENAVALPTIIDELGLVYPETGTEIPADDAWSYFVRQARQSPQRVGETRSLGTGALIDESFVAVDTDSVDAHEHVWFGETIPLNASQATLDAYKPATEIEAETAPVSVAVVCQSPDAMERESGFACQMYETDPLLDVTYYTEVTGDELRDVLRSKADFLHYSGHIEADGFVCADGWVDATTLSDVNIDTFFLNACSSYEQGRALLDAGSQAGVVTLTDVVNQPANRTGALTAYFLRHGFRFRVATNLADQETGLGQAYLLLGRGATTVGQPEDEYPELHRIRGKENNEYQLDVDAFGSHAYELGATTNHYTVDEFTLLGNTQSVTGTEDEEWVQEILENAEYPVLTDSGLYLPQHDWFK